MINEYTKIDEFVSNFDIVENALDMRNLLRWNGRSLRNKENLAEHTHLVVACAIKLYEEFKSNLFYIYKLDDSFIITELVDFASIVKRCMLHDSLEIFRGDILSITKDEIPNLRKYVDDEENKFMRSVGSYTNQLEDEFVELADLMACYKYIERELEYPSSDFVINVYSTVKEKYDEKYKYFCTKYRLNKKDNKKEDSHVRFKKGYEADAGVDVILDSDVIIMPMSTESINLNIKVTPEEGHMGILCARTSAAAKGLCVAMCPIDPNYTGQVTAIVHNVSNKIIRYSAGESFCQVVMMPIDYSITADVKKKGKRSDGKLGSTGI
jgi:dUTPase